MSEENVTLKDIARLCGVTPTVVSAVLNRRVGRVTCSPARRAQIIRTAESLNYRSNFFARSIKLKEAPIVGLSLYICRSNPQRVFDAFVNECLNEITYALNSRLLEVLFIPYSNEEEQLERLQNLVRKGLLGGIITNIMPQSHGQICNWLKTANLPYMVLGLPRISNLYCTYTLSTQLDRLMIEEGLRRHAKRSVHVLMSDNELQFREYPFANDYYWNEKFNDLATEKTLVEGSFYAVMGSEIYLSLCEAGFPVEKCLLIENDQRLHLVPPNTSHIIASHSTASGGIAVYAAETLYQWMTSHAVPTRLRATFDDSTVDYRFHNHPKGD